MRQTLPAVHRFLEDPAIAAYEAALGRDAVKAELNHVLDEARNAAVSASFEHLRAATLASLARQAANTLRRVINATGILLHTNLGRAPVAPPALEAMQNIAGGYSNLEYDLNEGRRGSRYEHAAALLRTVSGAEDALVVNNCAAAVLLVVDTFAKGREVVVARNQLIEIGGGFRLPEVLERAGSVLIEVGATNKVYVQDYERALSSATALLMRTHHSNFRMSGFTHDVSARDLVALGRRTGLKTVEDLGSGSLIDLSRHGLPRERTVQDAVADGLDLVTFSGDKLLGGPQAGIIAGKAMLIAQLRSNPLLRALRVDKMTLAALSETLRLYLRGEFESIPFLAMLGTSVETLRERAQRYAGELQAEVVESRALLGGGSLPEDSMPSIGIALPSRLAAEELARRLRLSDPPVVARIADDRVLLDLRTIDPRDDERTIAAARAALS